MLRRIALATALAGALAGVPALGQDKVELKYASFTPDFHPVMKWIHDSFDRIEKGSNGRIVVKRFGGAQMGPAPGHFDFARTGQADFAFFMHGGTPGRFALTELVNLPLLIGSAEIGAKVLNDPELKTKYLDPEHKGARVLVLMTHQPGQLHTTKKAVRTIDDMKGLRVRFASPAVRDFINALGGTAVGVPPTEMAEQLNKGTVDGAFTDYGGAGNAWKLGGIIKYTTELGKVWDDIDEPDKKALTDGGMTPIKLSAADNARMKRIAGELAETTVKTLEAKNPQARATYALMKSLADKHAKSSRNFLE